MSFAAIQACRSRIADPFVCGNPECKDEFDGGHLTESQKEDARRKVNPSMVLCQKCIANGETAAAIQARLRRNEKPFVCGNPKCKEEFDGEQLTDSQRE